MSKPPFLVVKVARSDLHGPDGLLQWVEELKAEAVLLGGPLDQLAGVQQHRPHPLTVFVGFIDEKDTGFQHAPQLGPRLQSAPDLQTELKCFTKELHPKTMVW